MRTLKVVAVVLVAIGIAATGLMASDKYYVPSWGMSQGEITTYPKGHVARVDFTPGLIHQQDKQGMPWFQSTLNPQNLRRENKDFLTECGRMLSNMFQGKSYQD